RACDAGHASDGLCFAIDGRAPLLSGRDGAIHVGEMVVVPDAPPPPEPPPLPVSEVVFGVEDQGAQQLGGNLRLRFVLANVADVGSGDWRQAGALVPSDELPTCAREGKQAPPGLSAQLFDERPTCDATWLMEGGRQPRWAPPEAPGPPRHVQWGPCFTTEAIDRVLVRAGDPRLPVGEGHLYVVAEDPVGNRAAYMLSAAPFPAVRPVRIAD
ncbi:MAG: hypothetical protein KC620_15965, partial [Myxococcales bacterium]|nr:hypothetical protein [Myxococcales bacterium]